MNKLVKLLYDRPTDQLHAGDTGIVTGYNRVYNIVTVLFTNHRRTIGVHASCLTDFHS